MLSCFSLDLFLSAALFSAAFISVSVQVVAILACKSNLVPDAV